MRTVVSCVLAVVNRSLNEDVPTRIDLGPHLLIRDVRAYEVNGADTSVHNSFAQPHAISVQTRRLHAASEYTFPAHSVTLLAWPDQLTVAALGPRSGRYRTVIK